MASKTSDDYIAEAKAMAERHADYCLSCGISVRDAARLGVLKGFELGADMAHEMMNGLKEELLGPDKAVEGR